VLGHVLKEAADGELVEALRRAAVGEIAGQLHLSVGTVETHRAHIQQKLRLTTRSELVRYALKHGLVDVSDS
jgi:two-component system response regulator NreC